MLVSALSSLLVFAHAAGAIWWGVDLTSTNSNVWTSIQYTLTVPAAPPSTVTTGPWVRTVICSRRAPEGRTSPMQYFLCGILPGWARGNPGLVRPVLQYRASAPSYVNPNPSFDQIWAMALWMTGNAGQVAESNGIWVGEGDKVVSTAAYADGNWTQTTRVSSGKATNLSIQQNEAASKLGFPANSAGDSNAQLFFCESDLHGQQADQWTADVIFSDVTFTANTCDGVQAACQAALNIKNDGTGVAIPSGFSMPNANTCYFETVRLVPPGPCTSNT
ncbi:hypothetical protein AURDEDRAFT_123308 [Auricularia subglabra TFB-10046 SS5]|nr:hypothetical protein AURDEDRAFT_123308 [Auricularia subglabra TFB-10046 SS5]